MVLLNFVHVNVAEHGNLKILHKKKIIIGKVVLLHY